MCLGSGKCREWGVSGAIFYSCSYLKSLRGLVTEHPRFLQYFRPLALWYDTHKIQAKLEFGN